MYHKIFNDILDSTLVDPRRCVSDRELHERIAKLSGMSLDDLQVRVDLTAIKVAGESEWQVVKIRDRK